MSSNTSNGLLTLTSFKVQTQLKVENFICSKYIERVKDAFNSFDPNIKITCGHIQGKRKDADDGALAQICLPEKTTFVTWEEILNNAESFNLLRRFKIWNALELIMDCMEQQYMYDCQRLFIPLFGINKEMDNARYFLELLNHKNDYSICIHNRRAAFTFKSESYLLV